MRRSPSPTKAVLLDAINAAEEQLTRWEIILAERKEVTALAMELELDAVDHVAAYKEELADHKVALADLKRAERILPPTRAEVRRHPTHTALTRASAA